VRCCPTRLFEKPRSSLWAAYLSLLLIVAAGCGGGPSHPVDTGVARKTLVETLDRWKEGETPEDLQKSKPQIVVQDMDWLGGAELVAYEVVGDGEPIDANLLAKVKLTLKGKDGKTSVKTVSYLVGTSPALTVFRDMMR
jgi:hypothetical protein